MPRGDRTGSWGGGPMTGRGLGYCAGFPDPGSTRGPGMGRGRGSGRGYGCGRGREYGYGGGRGRGREYGYGGGRGRGGGIGRDRGRGRSYDPYFEPYYGRETNYTYPREDPPSFVKPPLDKSDVPIGTSRSEEEEGYLKNVVSDLEEQLKAVRKRLKVLGKSKGEE